jgi:hypothetical protein
MCAHGLLCIPMHGAVKVWKAIFVVSHLGAVIQVTNSPLGTSVNKEEWICMTQHFFAIADQPWPMLDQ